METYAEYSSKTRSRKVIMAQIEARQRLKLFSLYEGNIYERSVDKFVVNLTQGTASLTAAADISSMVAGSYYYDPQAGKVYVWTSTGASPSTFSVYATYRFFYSNIAVNHYSHIAEDGSVSGSVVHYDARINSIGNLKLELDYENTGIAIETNSDIQLQNNDRYFDSIFDTLLWENQRAKFWSWNTELPYTETKVLYDGLVADKTFAPANIKFTLKDQLTKLKETLGLNRFSEDDGDVEESLIDAPKRLIFGRVDKIRTQGVDKVLDGFPLSGTISGSADRNLLTGTASGTIGTATITGLSTLFLGNVIAGNQLKFTANLTEYTYTVLSVASNTSLTLTSNLTATITGATIRNLATGTATLTGTGAGTVGLSVLTGTTTTFTTALAVGREIKITHLGNVYHHTVATITNNTSLTVTPAFSATFTGATIEAVYPENNVIIGTGTQFLKECTAGDKITIIQNLEEVTYNVDAVESDTKIIVGEEIDTSFSAQTATDLPSVNYRHKNRRWNIAGHKLREYTTTITYKKDATNFQVDDIGDIEAGDRLVIEGDTYLVVRVSGTFIRVNQGIPTAISSGYAVTKIPLQNIYYGTTKLVADRDYTLENSTDNAVVTIDPLAEYNVAVPKNTSVNFVFTTGSRTVTTSSTTLDVSSIVKPRDWVRARSINITDWYEVLAVDSTSLNLRTPSLNTYTGIMQIKSPDYIGDDALITADCLGLDDGTSWIRYPSHAVKWLLNEIGVTNINAASFDTAVDECPYLLALYYPSSIGSDLPTVRDMITDINKSVFGSLYLNDSFEFSYSILNADRGDSLEVLKDEDIASFTVNTKNSIINEVNLSYSPFVDTTTGEDGYRNIILTSDFVNEAIGKKEQLRTTSYLYREEDAETIAQRWLFFRSLTQSVVRVKAKLNLTGKSLNDKIFLELSRLYSRYGGQDRRKVGIINSITKDGEGTEVEFNDLGNIFNRVAAIAPNDAEDWSEENENIVSYGYIVDNDTETPDPNSEVGLGCNLIG